MLKRQEWLKPWCSGKYPSTELKRNQEDSGNHMPPVAHCISAEAKQTDPDYHQRFITGWRTLPSYITYTVSERSNNLAQPGPACLTAG